MKVKALGFHVYLVYGKAPAVSYRVDLRAFNQNGSCTCETFKGFCQFVLKHQKEDIFQRCDHILIVRDWVMDNEYWKLIDRTEKIIEMPKDQQNLTRYDVDR